MTLKVPLLRESLGPSDAIPVMRMAPWIAPFGSLARYWHMPRSAYIRRATNTMTVTMWCGQFRHKVTAERLTDIAPDDMKCGTCVGRREGWIREHGLVFAPVDGWELPTWCPGGDDGTGFCSSCGAKSRYHYSGWTGATEARHHPDPDLVNRIRPCYRHGWKNVRNVGGEVRCMVWRCES